MAPSIVQISVLVADERRLFGELLTEAIGLADDLVFCGRAATAGAAIDAVTRRKPDVVLLGMSIIDGSAEDLIQKLLLASPSSAVMVIASTENDEKLLDALSAGAAGFATLGASVEELLDGVRCAAARQTILPADFTRRIIERRRHGSPIEVRRAKSPELTARELEILRLLMNGLGNAEIASATGVATNTVKNHLYSIYRKLGVSSRGQAYAVASELGLCPD